MAQHDLKIHPQFWVALSTGKKPFEVRRNDRHFKVGDTVSLREYDPKVGYTGRGPYVREITFILHNEDFPNGVPPGYCVLGFAGA